MRFVPLAEGGSIDLDDRALDKGVRPDELVVARIVHLFPSLALPSPSHLPPKQIVRTTVKILVFLVVLSLAHAKLPVSSLSARYLRLPPRTRTEWTRLGPTLVFAGWRPSSNFRFLR